MRDPLKTWCRSPAAEQRQRRRTAPYLLAILAALATPAARAASERNLVLEVLLNGRALGLVAEFTERDGGLSATAVELREIGLLVPTSLATQDNQSVPLAALPGVTVRLDERTQRVALAAEPSALRPTALGRTGSGSAPAPITPPSAGIVLNYDLLGTFGQGRNLASGLFDLRLFNGFGVVSTNALAYSERPSAYQEQVVRLDTVWTYSEPGTLRRWRVGDLVGGGLSWTRPVRLGGMQLQTDFGLQPELITFPLPSLGGQAAVPSTVDVLVNGVRQLSQAVTPGPFELRQLPVVTGAGEVALTVRDALGRETVTTLPFYASNAMLAPGLASYSIETGFVRRGYGLTGDDYGAAAVSGSLRYGMTDWLTLEAHAEGTERLGTGGAGAVVRLASFGVLSAAVARSGAAGNGAGKDGGFWQVGFERASRGFSFGVSASGATRGYHDVAAENGSPVPRSTLRANLGLQLGHYGSVGLAYVEQQGSRVKRLPGRWPAAEFRIASASYSTTIAENVSLYATGFKDLGHDSSFGAMVGLSFALGRTSVGGSATTDGGRGMSAVAQVARPALALGDLGIRAVASEGRLPHRAAEAEYLGGWGRATLGVDQTGSTTAGRTGLRGAVTVAGGGVFLSDTVHDSFAVVQTGKIGGVGVLYENRPVGRTDASGRLLVPHLRSYEPNSLALDPGTLPADTQADIMRARIRPPDRSGVVIDFGVRSPAAALLRLRDTAGRPLPVGSSVVLTGAPTAATPVGHDGEAFLTELRPSNELEATTPDGRVCRAYFEYRPAPGELPTIGPILCRDRRG